MHSHSAGDGGDAADRDHGQLLGLIDRYAGAAANGAPQAQQIGIVEQLMKAARYHVDDEEAAMRRAAYPQAPRHYAAHRRFLSSIANLLYALRGAQPAPASAFTLKEWLATHLTSEDAPLYAWLDRMTLGH